MRNKLKTTGLRTALLFSILFLFSSCMTMAPVHSARMGYSHNNETHTAVYIDPVCGHTVEDIRQELFYEYNDTPYYFHSDICMNTFKQAPERYVQPYSQYNSHHHGNGWLWGMGGIFMGAIMLLMWL